MTGKRIGYIRVSTVDQNPERQLEGLELDKKFVDYCSGSTRDRPNLKTMLDFVREDDIVFVHSMDRLGRKLKDILDLVDFFLTNKIKIHFVKENLKFEDKNDPLSNCILSLFAAIAEFEYSLIRERQLEGIKIAQKKGLYKGRKHCMTLDRAKEMALVLATTRKTKTEIAKEFGVSRGSLYNYVEKVTNKKKDEE